MTTLQGTYIDSQPYVLVPLQTLIELLGKNAPVRLMTQPPVVIVPPAEKSEMEHMDDALAEYRQYGEPEVKHYRGGWRTE